MGWGGASYENVIPLGVKKGMLRDAMSSLKSDDIFMDIGAGDGHAIHQYREIYPDGAKVIGMLQHNQITLRE